MPFPIIAPTLKDIALQYIIQEARREISYNKHVLCHHHPNYSTTQDCFG
jgi:hypothetical protein